MDSGARGWVFNTIQKNYWRVAGYYEFEDLIQDSFIVWRRVADRYPDVELKQRMALFKTSFNNHIHDLSKKRTAFVTRYTSEADMNVTVDFLRDGTDGSQDPNVNLIIQQLPTKLRRMLERLYTEAPPHRRRLDGTRETTNERLCRLAKLDPKLRDVRGAIQNYLHGNRLHPQYD